MTDEKRFTRKWKLCRIVRRRVFVEEAGVPAAAEFDGADPASRHIMALGASYRSSSS